jgi:hypothetical protein
LALKEQPANKIIKTLKKWFEKNDVAGQEELRCQNSLLCTYFITLL